MPVTALDFPPPAPRTDRDQRPWKIDGEADSGMGTSIDPKRKDFAMQLYFVPKISGERACSQQSLILPETAATPGTGGDSHRGAGTERFGPCERGRQSGHAIPRTSVFPIRWAPRVLVLLRPISFRSLVGSLLRSSRKVDWTGGCDFRMAFSTMPSRRYVRP